ncbi:MAG: transporter [Deltaproteobacteria bacterium]|nr:transporter [Deltaproteobacteria bacterium]
MRKILTALTLFNFIFLAAAFEASAESLWKLSAAAEYETGTYGSGERTDAWYLPVTLKRYFDRGDISFTVPYIRQKSGPEVTNVGGTVTRFRKKAGPTTTNSGLGDMILKGSYYILTEGSKDPFDVSAAGKIKLPTADDKKGLGTGEFDEGVGLEFGKKLGPDWSFFLDAYYTFIGDPPGTDLRDRLSFDVGVSARIDPFLTASVSYAQSSALVKDSSAIRDVSAGVDYEVTKDLHIFGGVSMGLNSTSQDYGLNGGLSVRF